MPEEQTCIWTVSNCCRSCFHQYANFLRLFNLLCLILQCILFLRKHNSFTWIYPFKRKKNFEEMWCLHAQLQRYIYFAPLTLMCKYLSFGSFRWRQKYAFLPFWAPCLFWRSGSFRLCFRLIISKFQCRKVIRNAVTE